MEPNTEAKKLGHIVQNLQSLEFALRALLLEAEKTCKIATYHLFKIGDHVKEDAFTNYDTLGDLIDKFNKYSFDQKEEFRIDREKIVSLRDALAHGRLASISPDKPRLLLKFDKPINGQVKVTHSEELNGEWYKANIKFTFEQIKKVIKVGQSKNMQTFKQIDYNKL